jgi:opacity protein-like surface antigen
MRRLLALMVLAVCVTAASPALAADTTSATTLLGDPARFDGKQITVSGELIGDYGFRDDGTVWAQLNDDAYAIAPLRDGGRLNGANIGIGIHGSATLFANLHAPGRYAEVGPVVSVTGTWRYHDPERGGETYLEIDSLTVLQPGRPLHEKVTPVILVIGALLVLVAAGLTLLAERRSQSVS